MDALLVIARLVLAATFLVSGVAKLADLAGSRQAVVNYGVPQRFANVAGLGLPIVEILLALMLLPVATATFGALGLLVLLIAFIIGIAFNLARGHTPDCHCFGQLTKRPIGRATIIQDVALAALALVVTASGLAGNPGPSLVGWTEDLAVVQWVLLALVIVEALVLAGVVWLLVHLLGQNGRLLVRLDKIEAALADADIELADDDEEEDEEAEEDEGLPIGVPAPAFSLTGLYGETATLDSLRARGNPVLLVFSDPGCGPCNALMPDVGKWQRDLGGKLTVAVVTRGGVDANKTKASEHALTNVLLQNDNETADAYRTFGTPTGVLVSADGLIASGAAPGGDAIRKLALQAAEGKIANPKRIELRDAPVKPAAKPAAKAAPGAANIGKPAPTVELPDLDGNTVRLADFKGTPTAVLFWNPGCGFCQRMADDIKAWEIDPPANAPKLLVVSTGDAERNRAHGFTSPIVLDDGFNAGRSFGASGTPSAVLVGADGNVASAVAVGAPGVLGLLRNELPAAEPAPAPDAAARQNGSGAASVGKAAPGFELQDLDLNQVKLADFKGHPTAVLFWNPGCGFCQRMVDDIKAWETDPPANAPKLLVVSTGDAERNRAQGFASPVVLDANFTVGRSFGASGTPSAVLIDADGTVKSPVAVGAPGVLGLLRNEAPAVDDADDDEPETPSIGSPAPVVRLPDLNGNMVDLADHRGTRTLLVFWNPGCGFCGRMVDDLKAWEANPPAGAPKLMLVSTGSVEENKAQGLRSPILLDPSFNVGRTYGSTGTPSAIMIDARGNIASGLAVGAPGVLELARSTKDKDAAVTA
jgi:peroxiredoxin/uncharacterized membrane protein YphA (DoxX/SURF4 family)